MFLLLAQKLKENNAVLGVEFFEKSFVKSLDDSGKTVFHYLAQYGFNNISIADRFLELGALINLSDSLGKYPVEFLIERIEKLKGRDYALFLTEYCLKVANLKSNNIDLFLNKFFLQ